MEIFMDACVTKMEISRNFSTKCDVTHSMDWLKCRSRDEELFSINTTQYCNDRREADDRTALLE